ncbi:MAG: hypothetical protein AAFY31_02145 [Pseudomonadota bacterium]
MKPITDDDVFSILEGLEKRERGRGSIASKIAAPDPVLGNTGQRRILPFELSRKRAKRTVNGMFYYVARNA